jgi:hypothetical protein
VACQVKPTISAAESAIAAPSRITGAWRGNLSIGGGVYWRAPLPNGPPAPGDHLDFAAMSEQATSKPALDPETEAKLAWQEKEIMRLRDLLIGKDAELGVAKGKLAIAEDRMERLIIARERITTRVPGLGSVMRIVSRLLRGRR